MSTVKVMALIVKEWDPEVGMGAPGETLRKWVLRPDGSPLSIEAESPRLSEEIHPPLLEETIMEATVWQLPCKIMFLLLRIHAHHFSLLLDLYFH